MGYNPNDTWYPAENFIGSPNKVQEFHARYPEAAGPPIRLQQWINAYLKGDELEPCPEDNMAVKVGKKGASEGMPKNKGMTALLKLIAPGGG